MQIRKAERTKAKIRLGLFGPSGSGKTMSALKVAHGLVGDWSKVVVIDTENNSADLYAHLGDYSVLSLAAPFTPERYIEAITTCEQSGFEVIIIDSISHEWEGKGGCLEIIENMTGNSFANWRYVTPRHNNFIDKITHSPLHVICCGRTKTQYEISENDKGKKAPEKIGLKATTREGFDYEMTLCFDINIKHHATTSKDRTGIFMDKPPAILDESTGEAILEWANDGRNAEELAAEMKAIEDTQLLEAAKRRLRQDLMDATTQLFIDYGLNKSEFSHLQAIKVGSAKATSEELNELYLAVLKHIDGNPKPKQESSDAE